MYARSRRWLVEEFAAGSLAGTAGAVLIAWLTFHIAIVVEADCTPSQGDGQCGFATFTNLISALACGVLVWLVVVPVAFILCAGYRRDG